MSGTSDGWRTELIEYVQSVFARAEKDAGDCSSEERARITDAAARVVAATKSLKQIFDEYDRLSMGEQAREPYNPGSSAELLVALSAMRELASLTLLNPIALRIEKEVQQARAANGRQHRAAQSRRIDEIVWKLAEPHPNISASKLADSIIDEANREFCAKGIGELKTDAIRKRIDKLRTAN